VSAAPNKPVQRSSHVAPPPVVQAPPVSWRGPVVTTEILTVIQADVSSSAPIDGEAFHGSFFLYGVETFDCSAIPARSDGRTIQTRENESLLVNGSDRSRTPLDADVAQADDPPPPYASISLA
jgi:hypothetical protein